MHQRLEVAVQIQHHIGIAGVLEQQALQGLQLGSRRRQRLQRGLHRRTDQAHIGRAILAQAAVECRGNGRGQGEEVTVEILAAGKLETALLGRLKQLTQADGIGHRHQFDDTGQAPLGFEFAQAPLEFHGNPHARHLIGMQRGLDIGLARAAAIAKYTQAPFRAGAVPGQHMVDPLHVQLLRPCVGPDRPASGVRHV